MFDLSNGKWLIMVLVLSGCEPPPPQVSMENNRTRFMETLNWPEVLEPVMSMHSAKVETYDIDPFDLGLIAGEEIGPVVSKDDGGIAPDNQRKREPLEFFSLEEVKVVGLLSKHGREWAVIRQPNDVLTTLTIGNYIGKHHGRVSRIDRDAIVLVELRRHAKGHWLEREVRLSIADLGQKERVKGSDGE